MNSDDYKRLITRSATAFRWKSYATDEYTKFNQRYHDWIHSSKQTVKGLPEKRFIVSGVTDAFNQTYSLYKRIGIFHGEYEYHQTMFGGKRVTTDLNQADVIIVSHPFAADGMSSLQRLAIADSYNKPIFVDCAFFGICRDISFDFTQFKNIHSVCFSLSKTFGTGHHRVGLLYTIDNYPVCFYDDLLYPLTACAEFHYEILDTLGPDDRAEYYRQHQETVCRDIGLVPSNTVMFGLDYNNRFNHLRRGDVNRMCLTKLLEEMDQQTLALNQQ